MDKIGDTDDRRKIDQLDQAWQRAKATKDPQVLEATIDDIKTLSLRLMTSRIEFWKNVFGDVSGKRELMSDRARADKLIERGQQAAQQGDKDGLATVVMQLIELLPAKNRMAIEGQFSGSTIR